MTEARGGTDAGGPWSWRAAYDAVEAAQIIAFRCAAAGSLRGDPPGLLALALLRKRAYIAPAQPHCLAIGAIDKAGGLEE